jgi:hypothetical protein
MQLFLLEELVGMGATKTGTDRLSLDGLLYVRSTSFSQRVQAAAEEIYREYRAKKIKCLLIKDGPMLTLWVSQSDKAASNTKVASPPPAQPKPENPQPDSTKQSHQLPSGEKLMTYRGKTYTVNSSEIEPPANSEENKQPEPDTPKKRMYRGRAY